MNLRDLVKWFALRWSYKALFYWLIATLLAAGAFEYAILKNDSKCEMTFMFGYPEYIKIDLDPSVVDKFPSYNLYVYGEGAYAHSLRNGVFEGNPILFVPGNAGSYEQVRSLASVSLQMSKQNVKRIQFNFFAIDFHEELSGVFGGHLKEQVQFVNFCLEHISKMYTRHGRSTPITVIGHSIGGVVVRGLPTIKNFDPTNVDLMITLAAPHRSPVLAVDHEIVNFYDEVNDFWTSRRNSTDYANLTQLSIGGGFNDILVRSDLTTLPGYEATGDLSVVTTSIPEVWVSMDHLNIVWCKQFMLKLNRMLFDLQEDAINRKAINIYSRRDIIAYHMTSRTRGQFYPHYVIPKSLSYPTSANHGNWNETVKRCSRFAKKPKLLKSSFQLIKLVPKTTVMVVVDGEVKYDWVSACNVSGTIKDDQGRNLKFCESGTNLSPYSKVLPGQFKVQVRRVLKHSADSLIAMGFSHLNVWLTPNNGPVNLIAERFETSSKRYKAINLPSILESLTMIFSNPTILRIPISEESTFYNLSMVGLEQIYHAYTVQVETTNCYKSRITETGLMVFVVPWNRESQYEKIVNSKSEVSEMNLMLNSPKPFRTVQDDRQTQLQLYLDPDCGYDIRLRLSLYKMLGQLMRHFYPVLLQYMATILLIVISKQMFLRKTDLVVEPSRRTSSEAIGTGLGAGGANYVVISLSELLRTNFIGNSLFGIVPIFPFLLTFAIRNFISEDYHETAVLKPVLAIELTYLTSTQFILLHVTLFIASYSLLYILVSMSNFILKAITRLILFAESSYLRRNPAADANVLVELNDHSTISFKPVLAALIVIFTSLITSSGVAMLIASVFQLINLIVYSRKSLIVARRRGLIKSTTLVNCHLAFFWVLLINIVPTFPLALYWFKSQFKLFVFSPLNSTGLNLAASWDPHLIALLLFNLSLVYVWQRRPLAINESSNGVLPRVTSVVVKLIALSLTVYGHNYFIIPIITSISLLLITITCLISDIYCDVDKVKNE